MSDLLDMTPFAEEGLPGLVAFIGGVGFLFTLYSLIKGVQWLGKRIAGDGGLWERAVAASEAQCELLRKQDERQEVHAANCEETRNLTKIHQRFFDGVLDEIDQYAEVHKLPPTQQHTERLRDILRQ